MSCGEVAANFFLTSHTFSACRKYGATLKLGMITEMSGFLGGMVGEWAGPPRCTHSN